MEEMHWQVVSKI